MNKIKKIFISIGVFLTGLVSKAFALDVEMKYGVFEPDMIQDKYGVYDPGPTTGEKISHIGKFAIPVVLFTIGLFVILSKKITNKVKAIIIFILAILVVLGYVLMKYLETNF